MSSPRTLTLRLRIDAVQFIPPPRDFDLGIACLDVLDAAAPPKFEFVIGGKSYVPEDVVNGEKKRRNANA
ncbi:hypothetical protein HBI20_214180 [Parastagonospora nodorum]|nr:hypothetical protein HBI20_214180 [Parastagonospora nodorum]KAH6358525.1 hypothetical protein HBI34_208010 [Parastagonospora nodorum]